MQNPDQQDEDKDPRRVKEYGQALRGDEILDLRQVSERLRAGRIALQLGADTAGQKYRTQTVVQPAANPDHDRRTQGIKRRQHEQRNGRDAGEEEQRFQVPGRDDTIVNLHHVERRREDQYVDRYAE
jgi:hypothetical protein